MKFLRSFLAILHKDLLSELRGRKKLNTIFFFGLLITFLFSFAFGGEPLLLKKITPGLLWLVVLFSALLALEESFEAETEGGCIDRLILFASNLRAVFLGKLLANFIWIGLIEIVVLIFMFILFDLPSPRDWRLLLMVLGLTNLGIATLGTFYAALTATLKAREVMLPLLLFPMLIPLLLSATLATQYLFAGDLLGNISIWLQILAIFDLVFLAASLLACAAILEE